MLKTFLKGRKENSDRDSIEQYNQELQEAEAEFARGEYITHEKLLEEVKKSLLSG